MSRLIEVQFYGALRETFGTAVAQVQSEALDCAALWSNLCSAHGVEVGTSHVRVAVDDEFASWDSPLHGAHVVAFMPPFAGG